MIYLGLVFTVFMSLFSCSGSAEKNPPPADEKSIKATGYNLSDPDRTIRLPPVLNEVSGITLIDSTSVACVQDENGVVFILDLKKGAINNQFFFHSPGDYEDISRAGNAIYILRSDGVLFRVMHDGSPGSLKKSFSAGVPVNEYEGLCYDSRNNRLLVMPKHKPGKEFDSEGRLPVYGIDLGSETPLRQPVFSISVNEINKFAAENNINTSGDDSKIKFKPSAIGIHPLTNEFYVLSAVARMLFVFDMNGTIVHIEKLNKDIFNMPEGISFFRNGDMLISNEGQKNPPTILIFNYIRK
jgi:uncharacterized protein YjiK